MPIFHDKGHFHASLSIVFILCTYTIFWHCNVKNGCAHGRESDPPSVGDRRFCTGFSDPDFRPTIRAISPRQNQELPKFNKNFPNQIFSQTKAVNFLKQFFTQTNTVTFLIHEVFWWVGHICLISFPVAVRIDDGTQSTLLIEFRYSKQLSRQRNVRLLQLFSEVKFLLSQTHLTDFIDNSCKKGLCWSIHNDDPFFFSRSSCPGSGLSVCSNFSFERGFLVSQAHLPELASSCSKKELYSSIHNEDRFF